MTTYLVWVQELHAESVNLLYDGWSRVETRSNAGELVIWLDLKC